MAKYKLQIDDEYEQRFVQFLGWYEDTNYLYLAMEFLECGDLQRYFEVRKAPFEEEEEAAVTVIQQVAEALQFIHSKDFIHRNLKPSVPISPPGQLCVLLNANGPQPQNILVAKTGPEWHVKVADFGIVKHIGVPSYSTSHVDTPGYIAPEMMESIDYTSAVDVWALGAVDFYLRTGHTPFSTWEALIQYHAGQKDFPSRPLGVSTGFCIDFVLGAMHPLPATRLNIQQVLSHEWLHMEETCRTLTAP